MERKLLTQHFPNLNEANLVDYLLEIGELRHLKTDQTIINYGAYIKIIPLIVSGAIKVVREDEEGHELYLYHLNSGQTCAMSLTCCMAGKPSEIKAICEEDTTIFALPVEYSEILMDKYKTWKAFIMDTYAQKFNELLKTIDSIAFKNLDQRLLAFLENKSRVLNTQTIHTTHLQIAEELNSSREVISRLLKKMEQKGLIQVKRNEIQINTPL